MKTQISRYTSFGDIWTAKSIEISCADVSGHMK